MKYCLSVFFLLITLLAYPSEIDHAMSGIGELIIIALLVIIGLPIAIILLVVWLVRRGKKNNSKKNVDF